MRNTPREDQSTNNPIPRSSLGRENDIQRNENEAIRETSNDSRENELRSEVSESQDEIGVPPNRNEENQSSSDTERENADEAARPPSNAASNLFDGLIDNMLGMIGGPSAGNDVAENEGISRTAPQLGMSSDTDLSGRNSEGFGRDLRDNLLPGSNLEGSGGAIIITVNYVFADDNNAENRNRLGALFMTLPNFPSARDPRVIHEFVRLATQMAYSTLINGVTKEHGITTETFDSFKIKSCEEVSDTCTCPICFEKYEDSQGKKKLFEQSDDVELFSKKRRRLNRGDSLVYSESDRDSAFEVSSAESTDNNLSSNRPKLLSEVPPLEEHYPVEMPCGHVFGASCLFEWLKSHSTCPLCRNRVHSAAGLPEGSANNTNNSMNNNNFRVISRANLADMLNNMSANGNNSNERSTFTRIFRPDNNSEERTLGEEGAFSRMMSNIFPTLESASGRNRERNNDTNSQSENSFSNLLSYLRTSMRRNDDTLFPSGLFSRRTTDGVDTGQIGNRDIFSDLQEISRRGQEPGSNSDRENNE